MKNGKCPMCNSTEIYTNSGAEFTGSPDEVETLAVGLHDIENDLQIYLIPYICIKCGFTAMYASDMPVIEGLPDTDGWERVK